VTFTTPLISTDVAIALVRATVGLIVAAHGAQKAFGVWGGPGLSGWTQAITRMGLRPPALWAYITAATELVGGIALALGLLLPVVAALITVQMAVAIQRVHWVKGFWNGKGGLEFPLTLGAVATVTGLADAGVYSVDRVLGMPELGAGGYFVVLVLAWLAYFVSTQAAQPEPQKVPKPRN
jgi:putative oxidoreductase